jgi:hypothetical protein
MKNPHSYDDERYAANASKLDSAITGMWRAGASVSNIEETIANALENCELDGATVEITVE